MASEGFRVQRGAVGRLKTGIAGMMVGLCVACPGQSGPADNGIPAKEMKGFSAISEANLHKNLSYIASDKLAGRLSLRPGDDAAIEWVADQFEKAGLTPAAVAPDGKASYLQAVPLVEYKPDRAALRVTLTRGGAATVFQAPQVVGAYKDDIDLTAPLVFAGYGITAPELGYDDYKSIDAKGKIVLIFDHEPQEDDPKSIFNGTGNTRYATTRVKLLNAQAHGAVAVLIVAEPNRKHLTNAERSAKIYVGGTVRTTPLPVQALRDDELHIPGLTVVDAVAAKLLETAGAAPSKLQADIDKDLTPQSRALTDTSVAIHMKNESRMTGTSWNVAGLLEGSDPELMAETILISAHHDHDGESPKAGTEPDLYGRQPMDIWHGADDNGSGTVGVVELAQAFAANKAKPRRSILFVVFASEERGLLGSYWMAAHPLRRLPTTVAMINFDMIGRNETASPQTDGLITIPADTTNRLNLIGALYSPDYDNVVKEENKNIGLVLDDRFDHESALNVFFRSDQFPFVLKDIPAFWWFTGFHPDYHHTTDTADKINYVKMAKILRLAYLTAWHFGDADVEPVFVANPGNTQSSGRQ
jgi:acetylornithine deacetylase/succinyl-diaminopimelate desuccinylase-like protein